MLALPSPEINHRNDFAGLCNNHNLLVDAVEIGTHRGVFARNFLTKWKGNMLWCIDPWKDDLEGYKDVICWPRETDYLTTLISLAVEPEIHRRSTVIRATSAEAIKMLHPNLRFSFIYIDANHQYEFVKFDIETYYPLLRDGGILAGHDYTEILPGVIKAVDEFSIKNNLIVYKTFESWSSWYLYKPPVPKLIFCPRYLKEQEEKNR